MVQALPGLSLQVRSPGLGDITVRQRQTWRATHKGKLYVCDLEGGVQYRKGKQQGGAVVQLGLSAGKAMGMCDALSGGLAGSFCFLPSEAKQPGATSFPQAFLVPESCLHPHYNKQGN